MAETDGKSQSKSIVFFHPDLGIGGAERLIVDAAVSLQQLGHKVTIFTSHRNVNHCFDEARDGTLDVRVRGNLLPPTILGRFKILLTILRHIHLLLTIHLTGELRALQPDVFFVDQLSAGVPLMRYLYPDVHVLFYCHFPDLLLVQQRQRWWRKIWRLPFDTLEGWSMRGADRVVVNSAFTRGVVQGIWGDLGGERGVGVVYPCVDTGVKEQKKVGGSNEEIGEKPLWAGKKVILSINRFERKKDVGLAIRAFSKLEKALRAEAKLVIAGGYDRLVAENVSYHTELIALAGELGLKSATAKNMITAMDIPSDIEVLFLLSVPASLKDLLLKNATLLVYTPSNEHFGIVPLEAMLARVPVLASNTGGPLETVVEGKTGWLRDVQDAGAWTKVIRNVLAEIPKTELQGMGKAGKERVKAEFSQTQMGKRLDEEIEEMVYRPRTRMLELQDLLLSIGVLGAVVVAVVGLAKSYFSKAPARTKIE